MESARQRSPGEMAADLVGLRRAVRVLLGRGGAQEAAGGCEGVRLLECGRVQGALWKSERRHRASSCRITSSPRCTEDPLLLSLSPSTLNSAATQRGERHREHRDTPAYRG